MRQKKNQKVHYRDWCTKTSKESQSHKLMLAIVNPKDERSISNLQQKDPPKFIVSGQLTKAGTNNKTIPNKTCDQKFCIYQTSLPVVIIIYSQAAYYNSCVSNH